MYSDDDLFPARGCFYDGWAYCHLDDDHGYRYILDENGVRLGSAFEGRDNPTKAPITNRPFLPTAKGIDLASGKYYVRLSWTDLNGDWRHEWLLDSETNNKDRLLNLIGSPISSGRMTQTFNWLADSKSWIRAEPLTLASRPGWVTLEGQHRFVLDSDPEILYIGSPLETAGTAEGWAEGIKILTEMGPEGYAALAMVGLSAASPLVRRFKKRNPVIGLVAPSSTGKGSVINYALAIWANPDTLTAPAGSSVKGVQDLGLGACDFPLFLDEMQQAAKRKSVRLRKPCTTLVTVSDALRRVRHRLLLVVSGATARPFMLPRT